MWHRPYIGDLSGDNKTGANGCQCESCQKSRAAQFSFPKVKFSDYDDIDPKSRAELSRHQHFLCTPYVYGYILKDYKWSMFSFCFIPHLEH